MYLLLVIFIPMAGIVPVFALLEIPPSLRIIVYLLLNYLAKFFFNNIFFKLLYL